MLDSNSFRSSTVTFFGSTCGVARYVSCWWRWSDCYGCLHGFHSSLFRPLQFFIPHPRNAVDVISNLPLIGTSQAKFGCLRVITKDEKTFNCLTVLSLFVSLRTRVHTKRSVNPTGRQRRRCSYPVLVICLNQACTTCGPRKLFFRPTRAFSIAENVTKARPRISNCRSRFSSILQRNLYMEMK